MDEKWKTIIRCPKYEISNHAEVRNKKSKKYIDPIYSRKLDDHVINLQTSNGDYQTFSLKRLVCETFHGGPHDEYDVLNTDGDLNNMHANNLQWIFKKGE